MLCIESIYEYEHARIKTARLKGGDGEYKDAGCDPSDELFRRSGFSFLERTQDKIPKIFRLLQHKQSLSTLISWKLRTLASSLAGGNPQSLLSSSKLTML
jgi:hypothetical protein